MAERLGREPRVAVMQPANHREFNDLPLVLRLHLPRRARFSATRTARPDSSTRKTFHTFNIHVALPSDAEPAYSSRGGTRSG